MGKNIALIIGMSIAFILFCLSGFLNPNFPSLIIFGCGIAFGFFLLYYLIKKAVKDALREYDKEKAEANGQK